MKILVCGGSGFIGSAFIRNYLNNNPENEIINLDSLTIGSNLKNLKKIEQNKNYQFIKGDIKNQKVVNDLVRDVDTIINFAAESHVDRSIANPKPFIETNILGTYSLLEATKKYDSLFIHVSTDEVYGDAENEDSFTEKSIINPSNPYSATKASADHLVSSYHRTYGIKCITTRCTNNFGPYQFPEKLIPKTILLAKQNKKIPIYGTGKNIRDWIYVDDHCNAIIKVIEKGTNESYNISANNEIDNITIVKKILKLMDKSEELIEFVDDRPGHDFRYSMNSTKIRTELGWKELVNFDEALEKTVNWYLNNENWWMGLSQTLQNKKPWK